jgi:hypothetical protein
VNDHRIFTDERQKVLVQLWEAEGVIEISFRDDPGDVWGPPIPLIEEPRS